METIESLKAENANLKEKIAYLKKCLETQQLAHRLQLIQVADEIRAHEFDKGGPCFP